MDVSYYSYENLCFICGINDQDENESQENIVVVTTTFGLNKRKEKKREIDEIVIIDKSCDF